MCPMTGPLPVIGDRKPGGRFPVATGIGRSLARPWRRTWWSSLAPCFRGRFGDESVKGAPTSSPPFQAKRPQPAQILRHTHARFLNLSSYIFLLASLLRQLLTLEARGFLRCVILPPNCAGPLVRALASGRVLAAGFQIAVHAEDFKFGSRPHPRPATPAALPRCRRS